MGWRSRHLGPWPLRSKLGLAPLNKGRTDGTHDGEVRRLEIRSRKVANNPCDSKRKDKLITGCRILIDIYKKENEMRRKVYSKVLNEGKQKASMRPGNGVIVRKGWRTKFITILRNLGPFAKPEYEVF